MVIIKEKDGRVLLHIHVIPGSAKNAVVGVHDDALKIKIAAPPIEGRANAECVRFLSGLFGVKKSQVAIASGHRSRDKIVSVEGLSGEKMEFILSGIVCSH
jgi:hypothetical protein